MIDSPTRWKTRAQQHYLRDALRPARRSSGGSDIAARHRVPRQYAQAAKKRFLMRSRLRPMMGKMRGLPPAGGIGPWAMESYNMVKGWSAMMRRFLMNRACRPGTPSDRKFFQRSSLAWSNRHVVTGSMPARRAARGRTPFRSVSANRSGVAAGEPDLVIDCSRAADPGVWRHRLPYIDIPLPFDRDVWCVRWTSGEQPRSHAPRHAYLGLIRSWRNRFSRYMPRDFKSSLSKRQRRCCRRGRRSVPVALPRWVMRRPTGPGRAIYLLKAARLAANSSGQCLTRRIRIPSVRRGSSVEVRFVVRPGRVLYSSCRNALSGRHVSYEARYRPRPRPRCCCRFPATFQLGKVSTACARPNRSRQDRDPDQVLSTIPIEPHESRSFKGGTLRSAKLGRMFIGYLLYTVPRQVPQFDRIRRSRAGVDGGPNRGAFSTRELDGARPCALRPPLRPRPNPLDKRVS